MSCRMWINALIRENATETLDNLLHPFALFLFRAYPPAFPSALSWITDEAGIIKNSSILKC